MGLRLVPRVVDPPSAHLNAKTSPLGFREGSSHGDLLGEIPGDDDVSILVFHVEVFIRVPEGTFHLRSVQWGGMNVCGKVGMDGS